MKSYLGQILTVAERRSKVFRNVATIAEMPATKPPAERRFLDPDQARLALKAAAGDRLEALFVSALMLGLRPGELTGLRWADVDLDAGTLEVAGSLKREYGQLRLGDPKTPRSRRTLNLPTPVLSALRAHRRRQLEERLAAGPAWSDHGLVFTTEAGTPIDPSNLRRATRALTTRPASPTSVRTSSAATRPHPCCTTPA